MNDAELLRSYRETGSEDAFRELVARHIQMVTPRPWERFVTRAG